MEKVAIEITVRVSRPDAAPTGDWAGAYSDGTSLRKDRGGERIETPAGYSFGGLPMPDGLDPLRDALDFAIEKEEEARLFYTKLSKKARDAGARRLFSELAVEEMRHREKLEQIASGGGIGRFVASARGRKVPDLKIADYLVPMDPAAEHNYQSALVLAMQREKASFRLYEDFARRVRDQALRGLFLALATEEAKHKLRLETEYDEFLKEN
ncbi:MAG: ferritin family protein [Planctomycetota bacterium]|nr:ferritin family protein [Planctomycetota bacterium]